MNLESLPLPTDIINKIKLYDSHPTADMMRGRIAVGHTREISRMIRSHWVSKKSVLADIFSPMWTAYMWRDFTGELRNQWNKFNRVVAFGRGDEWYSDALDIVEKARKIYNTNNDESDDDDEDDDDDDYNTQTNPPYYCDGGCGRKVGEGWDHDCERICPYCTLSSDDEA